MLKRVSACLVQLTTSPLYGYYINNMLQSKFQPQEINIQPNIFHLYLHKLINSTFSQKFLANICINCYRTNQQQHYIHKLATFALENIEKIQNKATFITILNQMYHYQYKNQEIIDKLIERSFEMQLIIDNEHYMYDLKLIILINCLSHLNKYPQALYRKIQFNKFKPISICMVIQLFYTAKLEKEYPIVEQLIDMVISCQEFIPFADMHHLNYAIRKIHSPKFKEFYYRLRRKFQSTIKMTFEEKSQGKGDKGDKVWITDEEIILMFRKRIEDKYKMM